MMRKFTFCLAFCAASLMLFSCKDDEPSTPPKSAVTVDKSSGLAFDDEFTFTVDQVNAESISLLPYGKENQAWGGIPVTSFTGGKATVKFKYQQVGTFQVVVVTNNHNDNGDASNQYSEPITVTIKSDKAKITKFFFDKLTEHSDDNIVQGVTPTDGKITITVPYQSGVNTPVDLSKLKASFETSTFATVTVGSVVQESGKTENNFSTDVVYTVKANDGTTTKSYTVKITRAPIEQNVAIKSLSAIVASTSKKDRSLPYYIGADYIVVYDVEGSQSTLVDSIKFHYALDGKFAHAKYNDSESNKFEDAAHHMAQDQVIDLTKSGILTVYGQDSTVSKDYQIYFSDAPTVTLEFNDVIPAIVGKSSDFGIEMKLLKTPSKEHLTDLSTTESGNIDINGIKVSDKGDNEVSFTSGDNLDFEVDQWFKINVTNTTIGKSFDVVYKATLNEF